MQCDQLLTGRPSFRSNVGAVDALQTPLAQRAQVVALKVSLDLILSEIPGEKNKKPHPQWEFQDPKMEVLYHIRPYFVVGLIYGRYLQFRFLKWPLTSRLSHNARSPFDWRK